MNRLFGMLAMLCSLSYGVEIPVEKAYVKAFGKTLELNSKVIQLSNAKQSIMPLVGGHIEKYFVESGSKVKAGQKIALIESISLSAMTAEYLALKEQYKASSDNYEASKRLYEKGMLSLQELNTQEIQKNELSSRMNTVMSQLQTLGVDVNALQKASSEYILYAHASGTISAILQPLHSVIGEDTPIVSIVKEQALYVESYLPLEYADKVRPGQMMAVEYNGKNIVANVVKIMPEVDEKTQRAVVLSSLKESSQKIFINAYLPSRLYFEKNDMHVAVKKSALSFFENEWVVFVPKKRSGDDEHDKDDGHEEHKGHGEHEDHDEEAPPYEIRVVKIITQDEELAAVEGILDGEEYVSDKSYYVKSMMLKASLGEHGH